MTAWTSRAQGHVFENAMGAQQPERVADVLNGLPVVRFDGADDGLSAAEPLNLVFRRFLNVAELEALRAYLDGKWGL